MSTPPDTTLTDTEDNGLDDARPTIAMLKRVKVALLDSVKTHKTHRETVQDLHRNLLSVTSDLKDKLKENE